jgi:hypothetical protein
MRPLQLVNPCDLIPGKLYLIREKRTEYAHLNSKGVFVKNDYPEHAYQCTMTHFVNVVAAGNKPYLNLCIQDAYWNYYEGDAVQRAYINHVLREITGDPDFIPGGDERPLQPHPCIRCAEGVRGTHVPPLGGVRDACPPD